jgi:peptidyl-prolyl cis-trans isomerase SurA
MTSKKTATQSKKKTQTPKKQAHSHSTKSTSSAKKKTHPKQAQKTSQKRTDSGSAKPDTQMKKPRFLPLIIAIAVIGFVLLILPMIRDGFQQNDVVAQVNGESITLTEVEEAYQKMPAEYEGQLSKQDVLEALIDETILLQEAKNQGISMTLEETEDYIRTTLLAGMNETEQEQQIQQIMQQEDISRDEFLESMRKQLITQQLLEEQVQDQNVTEEELRTFYDTIVTEFKNNAEQRGLSESEIQQSLDELPAFEEIKENLRSQLLSSKIQEIRSGYVTELRKKAEIEYDSLYQDMWSNATDSSSQIGSFREVDQELCTENGKPIVTLYTTSTCPHCKWIKETFAETVAPYVTDGKIVAQIWELDTKDNLLTSQKEGSVPQEQMDRFMRYSNGGVPTFDFGCKYVRVGNGYEGQPNALEKEKADFELVIEQLLAEA